MAATETDYYSVLHVSPTASTDEIKASYRILIRRYHPDLNSAPSAEQLTEQLNIAYKELRDPELRAAYDLKRGYTRSAGNPTASATSAPSATTTATPTASATATATATDSTADATTSSSSSHLTEIKKCEGCGKSDPRLRVAYYYTVRSFILKSTSTPVGGVLCPSCRDEQATTTAIRSTFLGWWNIPNGILATSRALITAARGGYMPHADNAKLLREQGYAYLKQGLINRAYTSLRDSLTFEPNAAVEQILGERTFLGAKPVKQVRYMVGQSMGIICFAIPIFAILIMITGIGALQAVLGHPASINAASVGGSVSRVQQTIHLLPPNA